MNALRRDTLTTVVALLLVASPRAADAQITVRTLVTDLRRASTDIWHVWTSPFHATRRDWRDAGIVAGVTLALAPADRAVDRWIVRHPAALPVVALEPFTEGPGLRATDFGTGRIQRPLAGALYLTGFVTKTRALRDAGMGIAAAQQANSVIRHLTYEAVSRKRPVVAEGRAYDIRFPGGSGEFHSFFGGHVANAFSAATYVSERFELGPAEPALYAAATGIGLARMVDRRHWISDTFLGAAVGYSIGRSVAIRQKNRLADERASARSEQPPAQRRAHALMDGLYLSSAPDQGPILGWRGTF